MERDQEGGRGGGRDRRKKKWSAVLQTLPVLAGAVKKPNSLGWRVAHILPTNPCITPQVLYCYCTYTRLARGMTREATDLTRSTPPSPLLPHATRTFTSLADHGTGGVTFHPSSVSSNGLDSLGFVAVTDVARC